VIILSRPSKPFAEELVKDAKRLIVNNPATVNMGAQVYSAVEEILKDPRTETVYVIDETRRLVGIITVNDLLKVSCIQLSAYKKTNLFNFFKYMSLLYSEHVEDIMRKPISIRNKEKLISALGIMEKNNLSDLPVVDENNVIIGELNGLEILAVMRDKIKSGELDKLV
jgi:CBS domain-containing protein